MNYQFHRVVLSVLLTAPFFSFSSPATVDAADPQLGISPYALVVSAELGHTTTATLTLSNPDSTSASPMIYEALPEAAVPQSQSATGPRSVRLPVQDQQIDPQIAADLASGGGQTTFVVYLRDQADLGGAYAISDWAERGQYVYRTLTTWANTSQADLRRSLSERGLRYTPLWAVNAVLVQGTNADLQALSGRADVALLRANHRRTLAPADKSASNSSCSQSPSDPICWNIRAINADRVWNELGVTGQGVVVAGNDTGVNIQLPTLRASYRGTDGTEISNAYNWFDPTHTHNAPIDDDGHGSHTMGTIAGVGVSADQPAIGVAPGARWIAAKGCQENTCTEADLIAAAQWFLAPTNTQGANPRPDLRPMIVNNSWSGNGGDDWYAGYTDAWRAAGMYAVFAAGNSGPFVQQTCGTVASPADYSDVLAVGAVDSGNNLTSFSLLGPTKDGRIKPDVVAPGNGIYSAGRSGYTTLSGTSMAAPHVVGTVALLWSANPALIGDIDGTTAILRGTAHPINDTRCGGTATLNNAVGSGAIDAYAAVQRAAVDVPWLGVGAVGAVVAGGNIDVQVGFDARRVSGPGTYQARLQVYSTLTHTPISVPISFVVKPASQQATLFGTVVGSNNAPLQATVRANNGTPVTTDASGAFTLTVPYGQHQISASARGYLEATKIITVSGNLSVVITLLPDQPRLSFQQPSPVAVQLGTPATLRIPLSNTGTRSLHFQADMLYDQHGVWRSDEPGGPTYGWRDLPASAPSLNLGDSGRAEVALGFVFPYAQRTYTRTTVLADGMLTFLRDVAYPGFGGGCLPEQSQFAYTLAPLRADFDLSAGGTVRYVTVANTFILSYENVALRNAPAQRATFQVLLGIDGTITYQYQTVPDLPLASSVGLQVSTQTVINLGCGANLDLRNGLAIQFRSQPATQMWLRPGTISGTIMPSATGELTATLTWVDRSPDRPFRGRLRITSSDPLRPEQIAIVDVQPATPPQTHWFPLVRRR